MLASKSDAYLVCIHSLHRFSVGQNLAGGVAFKELHPLVPLMHRVGVLPKHHAAQQLRPALHQMLQPCNPVQKAYVLTNLLQPCNSVHKDTVLTKVL